MLPITAENPKTAPASFCLYFSTSLIHRYPIRANSCRKMAIREHVMRIRVP